VTDWTVEIGSWFLYLMGNEVLVEGKTVATPMGAVILEWPCSGLITGGGLMAIALALAFSKPWTKGAKLMVFLSAITLAFLAGCMRVVVMSYVVQDIPKFQFWHGTEGFLIFAAVTYSLFALSIFLAPRLLPPLISTSDPNFSTSDPTPPPSTASGTGLGPTRDGPRPVPPPPQAGPTPVPEIMAGKVLAVSMIAVAAVAWVRLPLVVGKHGDFPYPDLAPALEASAPELAPNPDPYAESSWGRVARYRLPQGELMLGFRPSGDFVAIRTIFRNLADNTPTEWETVSVPEGSVAWRVQDGKLELATLVHAGGKLTISEEEFGRAIERTRLDPTNLAKWFLGKAKLRDRRAVLVHLKLPGKDSSQVQTFVPVVVQAARLTAASF
jgi:exosortase/archaeosortase family protein